MTWQAWYHGDTTEYNIPGHYLGMTYIDVYHKYLKYEVETGCFAFIALQYYYNIDYLNEMKTSFKTWEETESRVFVNRA